MTHTVRIVHKNWLTHDVMRLTIEKPESYSFTAGQAIEATIDHPRFRGEQAPFTLTSLNRDKFLELIIKVYTGHNGMTLAISKLEEGDTLIITDPWDSFINRGPGVFIAGGTGITPFIAILRQLQAEERLPGSLLILSNKTEKDIILYDELSRMLGKSFINILTREKKENYMFGRIDLKCLKDHITDYNRPFYICGPGNFVIQIRNQLYELGINKDLVNIG